MPLLGAFDLEIPILVLASSSRFFIHIFPEMPTAFEGIDEGMWYGARQCDSSFAQHVALNYPVALMLY
jgi:hypothetical protein